MAEIVPLELNFERLPAKHKRFKEVAVFVHHYGGHRHSFLSTMHWLNELGFDVLTFDLPDRNISHLNKFPIGRNWKFGLRHMWADKIEDVLGSIEQDKFVFSYSFPSMATMMAIQRRSAIDVKGWICDGGPFKNIVDGIHKLVNEGMLIEDRTLVLKSPFLRRRLAELAAFVGGALHHDSDADLALLALPKNFPILSIRYTKDNLVSPPDIEAFFEKAKNHISIQSIELKHAGHLLGFKQERELYQQFVSGFLLHYASPLN